MADRRETDNVNIEWLKDSVKTMQAAQIKLAERVNIGFESTQRSFQELRDLYLDTFATKKDATESHRLLENQIEEKASKEEIENIRGELKHIMNNINGIQGNMTWIIRLVVGGFVSALIAFVIYGNV